MTESTTYEFTTTSSDDEVAMIDVAWQALSTLDQHQRSRAARYLADRAESHVYAIKHETQAGTS